MMKYRVPHFPTQNKGKFSPKSSAVTPAAPVITPAMFKKELNEAMLKKEKEANHQPDSFTKEKYMRSIEAWKERIKARKNLAVKHTEASIQSNPEDIPAPPYAPPPPYPPPPPYSNKNPKEKKPAVVRLNPLLVKGTLRRLQKGQNLEQLLETHGIRQGVDVSTLKEHLDILLNDIETEEKEVKPIEKDINPTDKWQKQMSQLKDLNHADNLEKWLEGLDVPHNVSAPHMKAKLKKYFMHETFETLQGRSMVYAEDSKAKKLWDEFKDMNPAKQMAVVVGITAVTAIVGFFTWELYLLAFPNVLAVNPFFVEVGAQIFIQRQEGAFHLLVDQTERSKPLSTAWANQYILWKYL